MPLPNIHQALWLVFWVIIAPSSPFLLVAAVQGIANMLVNLTTRRTLPMR